MSLKNKVRNNGLHQQTDLYINLKSTIVEENLSDRFRDAKIDDQPKKTVPERTSQLSDSRTKRVVSKRKGVYNSPIKVQQKHMYSYFRNERLK